MSYQCNHRVEKFNINGVYILQFGAKMANGQLQNPLGISHIVHNGKLYVTEWYNDRI